VTRYVIPRIHAIQCLVDVLDPADYEDLPDDCTVEPTKTGVRVGYLGHDYDLTDGQWWVYSHSNVYGVMNDDYYRQHYVEIQAS
jgi:hypothetical protein